MKNAILVVAVLAALPACKKDESKSGETSTSGEKSAAKAPAPPAAKGPFEAWDMDARRAAWKDQPLATPGATREIISPCESKETVIGADGSKMGTITHYTLRDGKLVHGLGDAGAKKGNEAIACISNALFVLDASGTCTQWDDPWNEGKYDKTPATCGFSADGTKFTATLRGHDYELLVQGDALLSEQLASK